MLAPFRVPAEMLADQGFGRAAAIDVRAVYEIAAKGEIMIEDPPGDVRITAEGGGEAHGPEAQRAHGQAGHAQAAIRSEEHTSELQSLMRISYAVFCLKNKTKTQH